MLFSTNRRPVIAVRSEAVPGAGEPTVLLVAEIVAPVHGSRADEEHDALVGMPEMQEGVYYIVPRGVAARAEADRTDLLVPAPDLRQALHGLFGGKIAGFRHQRPDRRPSGVFWSDAELVELIEEAIGGPQLIGDLIGLAGTARALDLISQAELETAQRFDPVFFEHFQRRYDAIVSEDGLDDDQEDELPW